MKCYLSYFKLKYISGLQYRSAAIAGLSTQFFFGIVYVMVYVAFYQSSNGDTPMTLSQVITYLWLNQSFFALIYQFYKDNELFDMIKKGNICYELTRPKNLYFMWFFKILGSRLADVTLRFLPILVVTFLLPKPYNMTLPCSLSSFILFIISLSLGALLVSALSTLYPLIMMRTLNEKGFLNVMIVVADLLSGVTIPIPFFPKFLQNTSSILPFQYISDLAFRIYVGNVSINESIVGIIIQIIWIIALVALGYILMHKNLKKVVIQGG